MIMTRTRGKKMNEISDVIEALRMCDPDTDDTDYISEIMKKAADLLEKQSVEITSCGSKYNSLKAAFLKDSYN